eukprot:CAMPEP_0115005142 /NCGR_PEP_ID=MMETSP0216-20121206/19678_1 /TAXON_ID=223996 /ORGANISM="Protocruzia adherens, Strain Boccale" /LENGTH=580 /DNA_ID=CAMNT_0002371377 /DNA_START=175 /DNA_END=1917 /DNA_ORIENTATION=+
MSKQSDLSVLELLKGEMASEEIAHKVNAINRIRTVAAAIGIEATLSALIPYLQTLVSYEDDEVLYALAAELPSLVPYLGDQPSALVFILESLCSVEETVIRSAAVKSLNRIIEVMGESEVSMVFVPTVLKLSHGDFFTARVSSAELFHTAYKRTKSQREKLRHRFVELCYDDVPIVKRAATASLGKFISQLEKDYIVSELVPVFRQLANDENESVRSLAVESMVEIAKILPKEDNLRHLIPVIIATAEDRAWRVRLVLAKHFSNLSDSFGQDITDMSLIQTLCLLLKDREGDVRGEAAQSLKKCIKNVSVDKIHSLILPLLATLATDSCVDVKMSIAYLIGILGKRLGRETANQKLIPVLTTLIKDEATIVRVEVMTALKTLTDIIGEDAFEQTEIQTVLAALATDFQWRVRLALIDLATDFAQHFGRESFDKSFEQYFMIYLDDTVYSIRQRGVEQLKVLAKSFGKEWVAGRLIPALSQNYDTSVGYLCRFNTMRSFASLATYFEDPEIFDSGITLAKKALSDEVANVRIACAQFLGQLFNHTSKTSQKTDVEGYLKQLTEDEDRDVRYFAAIALGQDN